MAFSRKFLTAMGIEPDKVDEIINAHVEVTDALKDELAKAKVDSEELSKVTKELEDARAQLETYSKEDSYKVKYEAKKEEFEKYKKDIELEKEKTTKSEAFKELLKTIGISEKRIGAVMKVSGDAINGLVLKDGKIADAPKLEESLKEEWADFIVVEGGKKGAEVPTPPRRKDAATLTREDILKIEDTAERQAAWKEYLEQQEEE